MRSSYLRVFLVALVITLVLGSLTMMLGYRSLVRADRVDLRGVARMYPNFSLEQRAAMMRLVQSQLHPVFRDLSPLEIVKRVAAMLAAADNGTPPPANFTGNQTAIIVAGSHLVELSQQADCSLTLRDGAYTVNLTGPTFSYTLPNSIAHYEQVLHASAGLTTTGGSYAAGCGNATTGVPTRKLVFAGTTTNHLRVYAGHFYYSVAGHDEAWYTVADANDAFQSFTSLGETNDVVDLATADLNGDGNGDLILINNPATNGGNATVSVALGKADGTFPVPTEITLPGSTNVYSAVIDDFNGDGKKDIVVASSNGYANAGGTTYYLNFLAGNGDGTFAPVTTATVTPPSGIASIPYYGLISADLRGSGHKDLVTSAGIVLLGNGNGTFTQSATAAFQDSPGTSANSPDVISGDFNKDGKPDLAVDNGVTIAIYLGKGDGTFTYNGSYAGYNNVGYLVAQDLDGDGNVDLYSGTGNNGSLGSDQFGYNTAYVLMGNGDGTFRGAPSLPFVYTGANLADLNKDGATDAVGVSGSTFVSYLNNGKGVFANSASLTFSPITINNGSYAPTGVDSFVLGDVTGDNVPDLVYACTTFYGPNTVTGFNGPGFFVATGKGDGSFNAPTWIAAAAFVQSPDFDVNPEISGVRLADMNHDGKMDIVYTYATASYNTNTYLFGVAIQFGNGDGTFQNTAHTVQLYSSTTTQANPGAYQIELLADVNKDGNEDMFLGTGQSGNSPSATTTLYLGNGDGTFKSPTTIAGITPPASVSGTQFSPLLLADMNNDGFLDIVAEQEVSSTNQAPQIAIALGNGDGTFKTPTTTNYNAYYFEDGIAVADFNGDGKLDVVTGGFSGAQSSGIAYGNGDGTLQTSGSTASNDVGPVQSIYVNTGGAAAALDLNGDGKPDFISGTTLLLSQAAVSAGAATSTTLTASASATTVGQGVTFTAQVAGPSGNTTVPTGTVTFNNGSTQLGSASVDGTGKASFSSSALAAGSYSVTATYSGDVNFAASTSTAVSLTISAAPPPPADFTIALGTTSGTASASAATATSTISITPVNGFNVATTLTCSGAPAHATCGVSPGSVTPDGTHASTATLTVNIDVAGASVTKPALFGSGGRLALAGLGLGALVGVGLFRTRRKYASWLCLAIALMAGTAFVGCGGGGGGSGNSGGGSGSSSTTPSGSYTIAVTATSGSLTHAANFTLTVQ